jgi:O-antigen/teichoic acid export membrane protein
MAHTLVDTLLATAIIVVWQRLYGAEETGWLSTLLRVLAFVPSVVHMAWAQVAVSQGANKRQAYLLSPGWLGMTALACVSIMSLSCALALHVEWLSPNWQGLYDYIMPLALWQGCACLSAAFSHRPFLTLSAEAYSRRCIKLGALQMVVLLTPLVIEYPIDANDHITVFALVSSVGLLVMANWMSRLRP